MEQTQEDVHVEGELHVRSVLQLCGGHTHLRFESPHEYSNEPVGVCHHVLWIELTEGAQDVEYSSTHWRRERRGRKGGREGGREIERIP